MRLFIEPSESLLFRTGRPFDAGQDTFAESLFPPTPETIQGAVRATIASYWDAHKNIAEAFNDQKLTSRIGDRNGYGRFRMTGLALGRYARKEEPLDAKERHIERLFSPPAHIMTAGKRLYRLLPHSLEKDVREGNKSTNFSAGIHYYLEPEERSVDELKPLEGWLTETDLYRTLGTGDITGIEAIKKEYIYQEEPRLGIGIQRGTKATEEGYLYQTVMIRMNHLRDREYNYGFVVDIQLAPASPDDAPLDDTQTQKELRLHDTGWMTLGGEQRAAHFSVIPTPSKQAHALKGNSSLLYLATLATFETGWKPSPHFAPLDAPLTAAINRYESIGGWRLNPGDAKGDHKAMRRCVPAGSVYFYNGKVALPQTLTDYGMEIGYGISYEGAW